MKTLVLGAAGVAVALGSSPVWAAEATPAATTPPPVGQVLLMSACPSDMREGSPPNTTGGILGLIGGAILKNVVVKAADYVAGWADKQNKALSAVSTYEGFGWFYGPDRLSITGEITDQIEDPVTKAKTPIPATVAAGCIVIARYKEAIEDTKFAPMLGSAGAKALARAGLTRAYRPADAVSAEKIAVPEFYAELRLEQVLVKAAKDGKPETAAFGFRMVPSKVYFGRTQAKRGTEEKDKKTLRLEVELRRFQLDKGALAEKPFYTGAFDIGEYPRETLLSSTASNENLRLKALKGPLAAYPAPAQFKPDSVQLISASDEAKPLTGAMPVDPVLVAASAKLIEAGDPGVLMAAIAKAMTDNKTKIEEAATSAALKAVADLTK